MIIKRDNLLEELYAFSQQGSGIIIGKPGIGKSYMLSLLSDLLWSKSIVNYIIKVDETAPNDEAFNQELSTKDWVHALNSIPETESGNKYIFIIDAFDAARDATLRNDYLKQIRKALVNLNSNWNVLVSVRTFDATKSPALLQLFPSKNSSSDRIPRYYEIKSLNEKEIGNISESRFVEQIYKASPNELKAILRIPFFLKVMDLISLNSSEDEVTKYSSINSEVELLDRFWDKKIVGSDDSYKKEKLVNDLANTLVDNKSVTANKLSFIDQHDIFYALRSDDILIEVGTHQQNVGFSHNIFFDYAVSRLISDNYLQLRKFIYDDTSRVFFLRPSFLFHFTKLWYKDIVLFWKTFWELNAEPDVIFKVFQRMLLVTVIAQEYQSSDDIQELTNKKASINIQQLLQAMRFLENRKLSGRDIELLHKLSSVLDFPFLWDFAFLLDKIINDNSLKQHPSNGIAARNFFKYILKERKGGQFSNNIDRLGATRGIDLITATYGSDVEESRNLLKQVLDILKEPNFEIYYFSSLAHGFSKIAVHDPEFVREIYLAIFSHKERSTDNTYMGSAALNLISNRRQDYELCYYTLVHDFEKFLAISPNVAIKTALELVRNYVADEKVYYKHKNTDLQIVKVAGKDYKYRSDGAGLWLSHYDKNELELTNEIFKYFAGLLERDVKLGELITIYLLNAETGYSWKKLIEFANNNFLYFKNLLLDLAQNKTILFNSETSFDIGVSIEKGQDFFSKEDLHQIELAIIDNYNVKDITGPLGDIYDDSMSFKAARLLQCFARENLREDRSLKLISDQGNIENTPPFKMSITSTPYTTERWLSDQGVDVKSEQNKHIYDLLLVLENFNRQWLNNTPTSDEYIENVPVAKELFKILKDNPDIKQELFESSLREVNSFFSILSRNTGNLSDELYDDIKNVMIFGLNYTTSYDESFNEESSVTAYSPTPKIAASQSLINLLLSRNEDTIFDLIKVHFVDKNPIVRFNISKKLSAIWIKRRESYFDFIFEGFAREKDTTMLAILTSAITYSDIIDERYPSVIEAVKIAGQHVSESKKKDNFLDAYVRLLLVLFSSNTTDPIIDLIREHMDDPTFSGVLLNKILDFVDPFLDESESIAAVPKIRLSELFYEVIDNTLVKLKDIDLQSLSDDESYDKRRLKNIDSAIQRIYFTLIGKKHALTNEQLHDNKITFYNSIEPILKNVIEKSNDIGEGFMMGHTAYNFIQLLNNVIVFYPNQASSILEMVLKINYLAGKTGFTYDYMAIRELVRFVEIILADHKELLQSEKGLQKIVLLLNMYVESGSTEALDLFWRLEGAFK